MWDIQGNNLCLRCYALFQQIMSRQQAALAEEYNFLSEQMERTLGAPIGSTGRMKVARPVIDSTSHTHNYIQVDRSVIGSINTGQISQLEVEMHGVANNVNEKVATALSKFTNEALAHPELSAEQKSELIEAVSFVAQQLNLPPKQRLITVIKNNLAFIATLVGAYPELVTAWHNVSRLL